MSVSVVLWASWVSWRVEGRTFGRRADWKTLRRSCWRGSGIVLFVSRRVVGAGSFLSIGCFLGRFLAFGGGLLFGRGGMVGCDVDIESISS